ncbi:MAG TPA: RNA polymerase sigma factor [Solirubrobacteraceae bacterium]|nr:RNA polymerase sigma factor [Solirubrobacteraceae bacterium]
MDLPPFQRLLDAHATEVHRFLLAAMGPGEADDVYQETWVAALRAYPRLRSAENLRGWIFTIARHKALDAHRARRHRAVPAGDALPDLPDPSAGTHLAPPDEDLWVTVAGLPPKQRTAVALRFLLDADYGSVAAMMGISEAAARRNVHEGLTRLRRDHHRVAPA